MTWEEWKTQPHTWEQITGTTDDPSHLIRNFPGEGKESQVVACVVCKEVLLHYRSLGKGQWTWEDQRPDELSHEAWIRVRSKHDATEDHKYNKELARLSGEIDL